MMHPSQQDPAFSIPLPTPALMPVRFPSGIGEGQVFMLRLDQMHPEYGGNKCFKLRRFVENALALGYRRIGTFGGPYSNHLLATAGLCKTVGLESIGLVRGGHLAETPHTLLAAARLGMEIRYMDKATYLDAKHRSGPDEATGTYWVPEGGAGALGAQGAGNIARLVGPDFTHIVCAVGTGTTMAGIVRSANEHQKVFGISVLKGPGNLATMVEKMAGIQLMASGHRLQEGFHFGGYAVQKQALFDWMNQFHGSAGIATDFVYTAKLTYAVHRLISENQFGEDAKIALVHSGGLQGNRSLGKGTLVF